MAAFLAALALVVSTSAPAVAQDQPQPLPILQELRLQGVTVLTRDLQSVSAEARTRPMPGRTIKAGVKIQ
jgi:hypothetical protein